MKGKLAHRAPARDLYHSRLWSWRRSYAEASGLPWLILSAKHGLLEPATVVYPYDLALADLTASQRRAWGQQVVRALERRFGDLSGITFEVHAGGAYRRAIEPAIKARGAQLDAPLAHVPLGSQPAWYQARLSVRPAAVPGRRRACSPAELRAAIRALDTAPRRVPASDWPDDLGDIARPGLYAWWADEQGAAQLV